MAKKAKEGTIDLYYLNSDDEKNEKKARAKKNSPSRYKNSKRKHDKDKNNGNNKDIFNFDDEIVIGINSVLPDDKKKSNKNTKDTKKKVKGTKKENTKNIQDEYDVNNEIVVDVNVLPNAKNNKQNKEKNSKKKNSKKKNAKSNNKPKKSEMSQEDIIKEEKRRKKYKRIKFIIKLFLIIALFTAVCIFLITSPIFNITKINVDGNSKVSAEQIISFSQIQLETNIYKMVSSKIEDNIKQNAYIDTVEVKRKLPNEVNITVTERKPQFALQFGNSYVHMSSQGYMLEITEEKPSFVVISGYTTIEEDIKPGNRLNQEDLEKLENVLKIMETATSNEIAMYISEINISDANNYTLVLESKGKTAYLGDASNITDKIIVLKQMIIKAEGKNGKAFLMDKDKMYFREE